MNLLTFSRVIVILLMALVGNIFSLFAYAKEAKKPANTSWTPFLSTLNQAPKSTEFFSQDLDADLNKLNALEIQKITASWKEEQEKQKFVNTAIQREQSNQFFYQKLTQLNLETFGKLETALTAQTQKKDYKQIAAKVLKEVRNNEVAKLESVQSFDASGQVGFCFGRALLVHYLLLKNAVPQEDLAKIFNLGQLMVGQQLWRFHVAVLVRDSQAGFLVVDPLQSEPLPYKEWIEINKRYEIKSPLSRSRFYVTDPRKFLPGFGAYHLEQMTSPHLKSYFEKLRKTL